MIELNAAGTIAEPQIVFITSISSTIRQRLSARVLRVEGRTEHGRSALRGPAGRAGDSRLRGPPGLIETAI